MNIRGETIIVYTPMTTIILTFQSLQSVRFLNTLFFFEEKNHFHRTYLLRIII